MKERSQRRPTSLNCLSPFELLFIHRLYSASTHQCLRPTRAIARIQRAIGPGPNFFARLTALVIFLVGVESIGTNCLLAQSTFVQPTAPVAPSQIERSALIDFTPSMGTQGFEEAVPSDVAWSDWTWTLLPRGFLYHTYLASSAEPRLSTQIFENRGDQTYLDSYIAGRLGIVRFGQRNAEEGFQLDLLTGAKLRQDLDHEIDMVGTDYRFDIPLTYRQGSHAWKFGFYHISSHTGDEFLLRNPGFPRLNYYRDSLYLGYSYYVIPELRIYAELDFAFSCEDSQPWHIQFGFDYAPVHPTGVRGAPFFAINGHLRQELNFGGNVNLQAGWAWRGEGLGAGILRTGPFYYNGGSPQFSFYQQSEQQLGWGLWYDY